MPSLSQFARRIRRRGQQVERGVNRIKIETAIALDQGVVVESPVITGRLRGGWQAGIGSPVTRDNGRIDPGGGSTINANNAVIETADPGDAIYISNNVEYVNYVNDGTPRQRAQMFVQSGVKAAVDFLRQRARRGIFR